MRALSVLSLKNNRLLTKEAGKILSDMFATNTALKELDLSSNNWGNHWDLKGDGPGFVQELAVGIKDNGTLSKLIFGGEGYYDTELDNYVTPEPATLEVGMTVADFSNKNLGVGGAFIISAWLTHKDNGAMKKLNLSLNNISGADAGKALAGALTVSTVLKELDLSGNHSGSVFAKELAVGINDNGALSVLSLKSNCLCNKEAGKVLAKMLAANTVLNELDLSDNTGRGAYDGSGFAQELAVGFSRQRRERFCQTCSLPILCSKSLISPAIDGMGMMVYGRVVAQDLPSSLQLASRIMGHYCL
jgi:hypothetical protein